MLNKRTIESLIKAGGFDSLGHPRQGLDDSFETIVDTVHRPPSQRGRGPVRPLLRIGRRRGASAVEAGGGNRTEIPDVEFPKSQRLAFEKEMLGLYVSEHPMLGAERALRRHVDCTLVRAA